MHYIPRHGNWWAGPIVGCLLAGMIAALVYRFRTFQVDDAFITYRYAHSLAQGHGFSYNPPEIVFGTTTPLYTLLLAGGTLLSIDIPTLSLIINGLSLGLLALVLYRIGAGQAHPAVGMAAAAAVVCFPGSYTVLGMETLLYTALVYSTLWAAAEQRYRLAALLGGVATLTRYDGALVFGIVALYARMEQRRLPWAMGAVYLLCVLPWLLLATAMFGSPLPNTFAAKAGYSGGSNPFLDGLPLMLSFMFTSRAESVVALLPLLLFGIPFAIGLVAGWRGRRMRPLLLWMGCYLVSYTLLRLGYVHFWYYYPPMPGVLALIIVGVWAGVRWLREGGLLHSGRAGSYGALWLQMTGLLLVVTLALGIATFWQGDSVATMFHGRYYAYKDVADWLCANTPPEATVAVPEIGLIGWFCPRFIIDPYGLVTPQVVPYVRQGDRVSGLVPLRPDYIVLQDLPKGQPIPPLPGADRFRDRYTLVKTFERNDFVSTILVYTKVVP